MHDRPQISAVICTYQPRADYLQRVINSYLGQTLPADRRELIIVDSASPDPVAARTDLDLPPGILWVRAPRPGLALARQLGAEAANSPLLASLDDDTVLHPDYLEAAGAYLSEHPGVAVVSGRMAPEFETPPPPWIREFDTLLALRDLGDAPITARGESPGAPLREYPACAPFGVNISRREVCLEFARFWRQNAAHQAFGRHANSLLSGEDNDFALCVLKSGRDVAYLPQLRLTHLIPSRRIETAYLGRLAQASAQTWVRVLALHGLSPWPSIAGWSVPLRKMKAWLSCRAWRDPASYIRWRAACGHFEGQALSVRR